MLPTYNSRRSFLKKASLAGITAMSQSYLLSTAATLNFTEHKKDHLTFLFQGDSITDGNRGSNTDPNHIMGHGYAFSIASRVGATFPEKQLTFYNRGVSGNTVADLAARWQKDTLDLKPDVLSILIGVNDVDQVLKQEGSGNVEKYSDTYRSLLDRAKSPSPDCLFVLCEPFILPVGRVKEKWNAWNEEMQKRQHVVYSLAKEYKAVYVPLQKAFDKVSEHPFVDYWIWDGIHPTVAGHEIIAHEWLLEVSKHLHFLKKLL